jgi:hypothetical protein
MLDAGIRTLKNGQYMPFFIISIAGFVILVLIFLFKGKGWVSQKREHPITPVIIFFTGLLKN